MAKKVSRKMAALSSACILAVLCWLLGSSVLAYTIQIKKTVTHVEDELAARVCLSRSNRRNAWPPKSSAKCTTSESALLYRPLAHMHSQSREFTPDTFSTPKSILPRHLSDQCARFRGYLGLV